MKTITLIIEGMMCQNCPQPCGQQGAERDFGRCREDNGLEEKKGRMLLWKEDGVSADH